jgi:prevent-host-death family protein
MSLHYLTSREFNQDTARAKREAKDGPVFITDRGEPSHVLLSIEEYRRLTAGGARNNLAELLWLPGVDEIELEIPPRTWGLGRPPVDLSD